MVPVKSEKKKRKNESHVSFGGQSFFVFLCFFAINTTRIYGHTQELKTLSSSYTDCISCMRP